VQVSMDGKDRWIDNMFIERLWRWVKHEGGYLWSYETLHEMERALSRWFADCNRWKPHHTHEKDHPGNVIVRIKFQHGAGGMVPSGDDLEGRLACSAPLRTSAVPPNRTLVSDFPQNSKPKPSPGGTSQTNLNQQSSGSATRATSLLQEATQARASLLRRARSNTTLAVVEALSNGSHPSAIYPSLKDKRSRQNGIRIRVIDYELAGMEHAEPIYCLIYRLITNPLNPLEALAEELAQLYPQRW
jgi:hypothetical protein